MEDHRVSLDTIKSQAAEVPKEEPVEEEEEEEEEEDVLTFGTDDSDAEQQRDTATTTANENQPVSADNTAPREEEAAEIIDIKPEDVEVVEVQEEKVQQLSEASVLQRREARFGTASHPSAKAKPHSIQEGQKNGGRGPSFQRRGPVGGGRFGGRGQQLNQSNTRPPAPPPGAWAGNGPPHAGFGVRNAPLQQPRPPPYPPPPTTMANVKPSSNPGTMGTGAFQNGVVTGSRKDDMMRNAFKSLKAVSHARSGLDTESAKQPAAVQSAPAHSHQHQPAGHSQQRPPKSSFVGMQTVLPAPMLGSSVVTNVAPASTWVRKDTAAPSSAQPTSRFTSNFAPRRTASGEQSVPGVAQASTWVNPKLNQQQSSVKASNDGHTGRQSTMKQESGNASGAMDKVILEKDLLIKQLQEQLRQAEGKKRVLDTGESLVKREPGDKRMRSIVSAVHQGDVDNLKHHKEAEPSSRAQIEPGRTVNYDANGTGGDAPSRVSIHDRLQYVKRAPASFDSAEVRRGSDGRSRYDNGSQSRSVYVTRDFDSHGSPELKREVKRDMNGGGSVTVNPSDMTLQQKQRLARFR